MRSALSGKPRRTSARVSRRSASMRPSAACAERSTPGIAKSATTSMPKARVSISVLDDRAAPPRGLDGQTDQPGGQRHQHACETQQLEDVEPGGTLQPRTYEQVAQQVGGGR